MNTTATFTSEHSFTRRCSTETVFSIQGQETDFVRDTSDTEAGSGGEYEPVSDSDNSSDRLDWDSSEESENEIIKTRVVEASVNDDGEVQFADGSADGSGDGTADGSGDTDTDTEHGDSPRGYSRCVRCLANNDNPLYSYCIKCFKVRKNLFPPRPKRKRKCIRANDVIPRSLSQDSGVGSQECSQTVSVSTLSEPSSVSLPVSRKRRADSADRNTDKRPKHDHDSESSDGDSYVAPLPRALSDPAVTIDDSKVTKKVISNKLKERLANDELCIVCVNEPKSGVFVHGRVAHICCCYRCAVRVWATAKRCPVCNSKVSNVLKAIVM